MNETPDTPSPLSIEELQDRLGRLRIQLDEQEKRQTRRRKVFLICGFVLMGVCFFSLASLTSMASRLDAHALTQIARLELERHLPEGRENFAGYLKAEAPLVVRHTLLSMLGFLPEFRAMVVQDLDTRLTAVTAEGEALLIEEMRKSVQETRKRLDTTFPDLSDEEKLELLISQVADSFSMKMKTLLDSLYPEYVAEMQRVESFLSDLSTYDDSRLTRKERMHKELIQTLLKLMVLEKDREREAAGSS